jgi:DNA adenine methylase
MVEYTCEKCDKVFKQKSQYTAHNKRKTPCKKNNYIEQLVEKKVKEALSKVALTEQASSIDIHKPFLKWVGGKTQIIGEVLNLFPKEMVNYYEPFLGGGSVLLALLSYKKAGAIKITGQIFASDLNANLINLYKNIQANPQTLIAEVKTLSDEFAKATGTTVNRKAATLEEALTSPESYYFWIRGKFNSLIGQARATPPASAMLLFMNKTCFRGVYREGPHGINVPYGNYKNATILDEAHILATSELIKDVVFTCAPFSNSLVRVLAEDFVYLDPPYAPEDATSFVGYTSDGFNLESHKTLFTLCGQLQAKFLMSNASVQLVKDAFPSPKYQTKIISCRRAINSKKPEAKTNEVLIWN